MMVGKYRAYSKYKPSAIMFLGNVPSHWPVTLLKRYCNITDGSHHSPAIKERGKPFVSVTDIGQNAIDFKNCKKISVDDYNRLVREGCKPNPGEILLTKDGTIGRAAIVNEKHPDFVILSSLGLLAPQKKFYNQFLYYFLISGINVDQMNSLIHGSALKRMTIRKIANLTVTIPHVSEQTQIADFLDHETAKIDRLIEKQQQLIKLLKEKRQAVISHAVTKGLDPTAPMRDSGVEWLDDVPAHWKLIKLSIVLKLRSGDSITSDSIRSSGEFPVYGGNGQRGFTSDYNNNGKYILIGRQGALCGNINIASGKFYASEHAIVVYPQMPQSTTYLAESLRFMNLGQYSTSAAQPGISVERLDLLKVLQPPHDEQKKIAEYISLSIPKFDLLVDQSQTMIALLKERRTALISAAVTGKIDVRDWPTPEAPLNDKENAA